MPVRQREPATRMRGPVTALGPPPSADNPPPYTWEIAAGQPLTAMLIAPADTLLGGHVLGARIEVPGSRAIVSYWKPAILTGQFYSVTLDGVVDPGAYNLVWMTNDDPPTFTSFWPLVVVSALTPIGAAWPPVDAAAVRPTVQEIADLDMTRAVDQTTGENVGTFNANTFPTDTQVAALIDDALSDVLAQIPDAIDPEYYDRVKYAVKLATVILLEEGYFRNEAQMSGQVATWTTRLNMVMQALQATEIGTAQRLR